MRRAVALLLSLFLLLFPVHAASDPNIDGGGGDMGGSIGNSSWSPGDDGVRITVVRIRDRTPVTTPIDITNCTNTSRVQVYFGMKCKLVYTTGTQLSPTATSYKSANPAQSLPRIISSSGASNAAAVKAYFSDEQVIRSLAPLIGMDLSILTNGQYALLLEPIAYFKYNGIQMAMTATEAALYDIQTGGDLNYWMGRLTRKNLPLSIFLERDDPDLGYRAWTGSTTTKAANEDIIASLGIGIVRFGDPPDESVDPGPGPYDYTYRTGTEVITSVTVSGGQSDPDSPTTVRFHINGTTYTVSNVYYPSGDSQLVWVRWRTPSTPQDVTITVDVSGPGRPSASIIHAQVVDLSGKDPPDPLPDDRNDAYRRPASAPNNSEAYTASWSVWRPYWTEDWVWHETNHLLHTGYWCDHGWWSFRYDSHSASLTAYMHIAPDAKAPTATASTLKSGYGINETVTAQVSTDQSAAVTGVQTAVTYFPEFQYTGFWRLLECVSSGYSARFEFAANPYSTYGRRTHFTPIWFPDGSYTPYTWLLDCWTPTGMLSANLTDTLIIRGSLWDDWHIAKQ